MPWVIDTSVLVDIRIGLPEPAAIASAECLQQYFSDGLLVCPVTFIEISPMFHGDLVAQRSWLDGLGIARREPWIEEDTERCHALWNDAIQRKRNREIAKRPVADILIAGFAIRFQGLITRNESDFRTIAPQLTIVAPK
jgi:predicted nucleic acid-binding protein